MATDTSLNSKPADVFKTFPEFSSLTFADREQFSRLVADYPPLDDITFASLMSWWSSMEACKVATYNDNLIISYWLPGMEQFSGLSVIGETKLDQTICEIFDNLLAAGEAPRLVHVPEFVVRNIEHPELFYFTPLPEFDEYVLSLASMHPLANQPMHKQRRIEAFLKRVAGKQILTKSLDLTQKSNRQLILAEIKAWPRHGKGNDFSTFSDEVMHDAIEKHALLDTKNLCLFVDDTLQACMVYYPSQDSRYAVVGQFRANNQSSTFDYATYAFCGRLIKQGFEFANLSYDLGLQRLRTLKIGLGPTSAFRKYIVEPANIKTRTDQESRR
jgi:hypothetical protein